jgi:hypothetical protein
VAAAAALLLFVAPAASAEDRRADQKIEAEIRRELDWVRFAREFDEQQALSERCTTGRDEDACVRERLIQNRWNQPPPAERK